jgi:SAM-dependent methyltransferase
MKILVRYRAHNPKMIGRSDDGWADVLGSCLPFAASATCVTIYRTIGVGGFVTDRKQLQIAPNDTMYEGNPEHYFSVGQSAVHCVRTAMMAADKGSLRNILDFACGFGRVLRALKGAFPAAELTACDISREAIDFCADAFGATPVLSSEKPAEIEFATRFDLIWCGTLLTQFDAPEFSRFLGLLQSLLTPGGLLVFTTHGPFVARRLREHVGNYGLDEKSVSTILDHYDATGFGYADYPTEVLARVGVSKYGISISKPSWVCREIETAPNMRLIMYTEKAWDNHQDAVACTRDAD